MSLPFLFFLLFALSASAAPPIQFHTDRSGFVSLNLYRPDGSLARQLLSGAPFQPGDHALTLPATPSLPPGNYTWRALFHGDLALKLHGWIGDFGGDRGPPSATAADDTQVYLGWSLATADADAIVACDFAGNPHWTQHRGPLSGCRSLSVDAGTLYVLGGQGPDAEGRAIFKLRARDGTPIPWPDGRIDLKITSLWPANGNYKPALADDFAAKNGRIYLSFNSGQFIAILDAKTGKYLQTIVGGPPGAIAAVGTKSDDPNTPGSLIDSDFVVTTLSGVTIGKLLLAHDPIWVLASELTPLAPGQHIAALALVPDNAKHHPEDIFAALAPPVNVVQARPALAADTVTYIAGTPGAPAPQGPWHPGVMAGIRAIALDATGQLWVAEAGGPPGRISVWSTDTPAGSLLHEFFPPPDPASPIALDPLDPDILFASGCEWRIDPATGRAACLGVVTGDHFRAARFVMDKNRLLLVLTPAAGPDHGLERVGDGDYRPHPAPVPAATPPAFTLLAPAGAPWMLTTADGFALGAMADPTGSGSHAPLLWQTAGGKFFITARTSRVWSAELTGLDTVRPLATGKITLP